MHFEAIEQKFCTSKWQRGSFFGQNPPFWAEIRHFEFENWIFSTFIRCALSIRNFWAQNHFSTLNSFRESLQKRVFSHAFHKIDFWKWKWSSSGKVFTESTPNCLVTQLRWNPMSVANFSPIGQAVLSETQSKRTNFSQAYPISRYD